MPGLQKRHKLKVNSKLNVPMHLENRYIIECKTKMALNTESDATYCSEIEKEDRNLIRRSKRLSQRSFLCSFRSNGDPIHRLYEIYQTLKCGDLSWKWLIDDWKSLKVEVELIQKFLKGKQKGRISFILKKINKNLQKASPNCPNESATAPASIQPDQNNEQVKSPNILAGMMTEVLTEIPPYQPNDLAENVNAVQRPGPSIALTQKNPLDLTKKNFNMHVVVPNKVLTQGTSEPQKPRPARTITPKKCSPLKQQQQQKTPTSTNLSVSKDSMIDLTEENLINTNRENIPPVIRERTAKPKSPIHVSKWLKFLPTQDRPKLPEHISKITTKSTTIVPSTTVVPSTAIASRQKPKSLKDSIVKLYRDRPAATTSISNTVQKTLSGSKKTKHIHKQNTSPIKPHTNQKCQKHFRYSESIIPRDRDSPRTTPPPRNVLTENIGSISPDFLLDEFLDLNASDMNNSGNSLAPSLKEDFRKIFGTDKLCDVFGDGEVVYELKEHHVRRLATALNIEYSVLKKNIEDILSNENFGGFEDENMRSDSSVVECSQSPPQRLFPSQRSQT